MTEELEFPELKRAYLQSLPSEQEILTRLRNRRRSVEAPNSNRLPYTFGLVGAVGLVVVALFLTRNNGAPTPHLSAERLRSARPTLHSGKTVPTNDSVSHSATSPQDFVEVPLQREPAVVKQPPGPKSNRSKPGSTQTLERTVASGGKATWSEVGTLLRNGQDAEAQSKIAELAQSEDVETREGAQLFQLRQKVQSARKTQSAVEPGVRAELQRLANGGSTSSIRLTAKRLLAESM